MMPIKVQTKVTYTDLHENMGTVLMVDHVDIEDGTPDCAVLIGVIQRKQDGSGDYERFTVENKEPGEDWRCRVHRTGDVVDTSQWTLLENAIGEFEQRTGIRVPPVPVIHPGVGVWIAQRPQDRINPWKLEDGKSYWFINRLGRRTEFTVDENRQRTLLIVNEAGGLPLASEISQHDLTTANWKSLCEIKPGAKVDHLMADHATIKEALLRLEPSLDISEASLGKRAQVSLGAPPLW